MRIDELLARSGEPSFSFEFFPPKTPEGEENLYAALRELQPLEPAYVSRHVRRRRHDAREDDRDRLADQARASGWRRWRTSRASTRPPTSCAPRWISMRDAGVENVLALRGDPPQGEDRWTKTEGGLEYSRELVELICGPSTPRSPMAGAAFPETHIHADLAARRTCATSRPRSTRVRHFLVTQLFFDNALLLRLRRAGPRGGITSRSFRASCRSRTSTSIKRMTTLSGSALPAGARAGARGASRGLRGGR